jgi:ubiquinone/menaquinone biosynthesis C-methylase UbiE
VSAARTIGIVGVVVAAGYYWLRTHPEPFPYSQRALLLPLPYHSPERLEEILEPRPGERMLEIGPGTGDHAIAVARRIAPGGRVDVVDVHQEWLDHTMREAGAGGVEGIVPARGDARELPYADATFDGAFLSKVLGEVPDQDAALRELARVLKPGGRLVVGETPLDPHYVTPRALRARAEAAGLRFERQLGPAVGYFARFVI